MKLSNFRGVFMRDQLSIKSFNKGCRIMNLDM